MFLTSLRSRPKTDGQRLLRLLLLQQQWFHLWPCQPVYMWYSWRSCPHEDPQAFVELSKCAAAACGWPKWLFRFLPLLLGRQKHKEDGPAVGRQDSRRTSVTLPDLTTHGVHCSSSCSSLITTDMDEEAVCQVGGPWGHPRAGFARVQSRFSATGWCHSTKPSIWQRPLLHLFRHMWYLPYSRGP